MDSFGRLVVAFAVVLGLAAACSDSSGSSVASKTTNAEAPAIAASAPDQPVQLPAVPIQPGDEDLDFAAPEPVTPAAGTVPCPKDYDATYLLEDEPYGNNGMTIAFLRRKAVSTGVKLPIVVLFHGGAWNDPGSSEYDYFAACKHGKTPLVGVGQAPALSPFDGRGLAERLADKGFLVASVRYRLVCLRTEDRDPALMTPEEKKVVADPRCSRPRTSDVRPYSRTLEDVYDAIRYVTSSAVVAGTYRGDPDRVGLVGASAGAHLVLMAATNPPSLSSAFPKPFYSPRPAGIKAVVALSPIVDLTYVPMINGTQGTVDVATQWYLDCGPGDPCEPFRSLNSPLARIQKPQLASVPKIFIGGSEDDTYVPQAPVYEWGGARSVSFFEAAQKRKALDRIYLVPASGAHFCHGNGCLYGLAAVKNPDGTVVTLPSGKKVTERVTTDKLWVTFRDRASDTATKDTATKQQMLLTVVDWLVTNVKG